MQELYGIHQSREAKREIDQIGREAKHQYKQWKKTLSGTLSDKQLSLGLTLLFVFYVFYASFGSISGENNQDEDFTNCTCSETHRVYYQTLVITFSIIWIICFCLIAIWDLMRFCHFKPTNRCFRWERMMNVFVSKAEKKITQDKEQPDHQLQPSAINLAAKPHAVSSEPLVPSAQADKSSMLQSLTFKRLDHYENYLWLQFNRVYSVGAALGKHKPLKLPKIKSVVADENKIRRKSMRKMSIQVNGRLLSTATVASEDESDGEKLFENIDEEDFALKTADMTCSMVAFFLYPFLLSVRLAAQAALIPLLILQVLDTHAWICLLQSMYCDGLRAEYQLSLDRTAMSFAFYCSVLVTILTSTMLHWFPCSKKAKKSGATTMA